MARGILFPAGLIVVFLVHQTCSAVDSHYCPSSSCGNIRNIHYPFRLKSDPENCGDQRYNLSCENNQTVLYLYDGRYYVREIYYNNYTIRVVDPGILNANGSFIPRYSLVANNFSFGDPYQTRSTYSDGIIFVKCEKPLNSGYDLNISACFEDGVHFSNSSKRYNRYALFRRSAEYLEDLCQIEQVSLSSWSDRSDDDLRNISCTRIHNELLRGFELLWYRVFCGSCKYCHLDDTNSVSCSRNGLEAKRRELIDDKPPPIRLQTYKTVGYGLFQATKMILVTPFVIAFLIFKCHRRHLSDVEEFLQSHDNPRLVRYSYSEIRKMTKNFKDRIDGPSPVFKGTLRSGRFVAIKLFWKSERYEECFINEVETLGRIRHVNVVQLIGFCVERSKRALVYEFMPNGSLNKYLYSPEVSTLLSYDKMFDIALGVAHAIEYLHQGCDMQILHFDIKPHIILLDESFNPKVSSFDLAMLHPKDDDIISLDGPRGTLGYVAPELFYKNIGDISCKVDVYSFGMLLMDMAGRRRNYVASSEDCAEDLSVYYHDWANDQLINKIDIELEDVTEKEKKIVKKMIIVALWCIQTKPIDRPLMNEVVEMLKGKLERLQMPSEAFSFKHLSFKPFSSKSLSSKPFSSKPFFSSTEGL